MGTQKRLSMRSLTGNQCASPKVTPDSEGATDDDASRSHHVIVHLTGITCNFRTPAVTSGRITVSFSCVSSRRTIDVYLCKRPLSIENVKYVRGNRESLNFSCNVRVDGFQCPNYSWDRWSSASDTFHYFFFNCIETDSSHSRSEWFHSAMASIFTKFFNTWRNYSRSLPATYLRMWSAVRFQSLIFLQVIRSVWLGWNWCLGFVKF